MCADEDMFAFGDKQFARGRVQISFHTVFLLLQALFGLLEIIRYRVLGDERL
jgi:hypothetical protein